MTEIDSLDIFLADGAKDGADFITLQLFVSPVYLKGKIAAQSNHYESAKKLVISYVHFRKSSGAQQTSCHLRASTLADCCW